jgi:Polysaccharide lyase
MRGRLRQFGRVRTAVPSGAARRICLFLLAITLTGALLSSASGAPARLWVADEWIGNFETGDFSQWSGIQRAETDRIRIVTDPVRDGRFAARFDVQPGDYPAGRTGERAELFVDTADRDGTECYYAWSTLFPTDFVSDPVWKQMFVQWHGPGSSAASVSFQVSGSRLIVRAGSPWTPTTWAQYDLGPLVLGSWQDFILHVRWGGAHSGFLEIWRNGKLVVPRRYHQNVAPGTGNYLKLGYYRDPSVHPTVIYEDGMRRASSLAGVVSSFRLQFVSPPVLNRGVLSFEARSFAQAKVVVELRKPKSRRWLRVATVAADGSGRLPLHLAVPRRLRGARSLRIRALVDRGLDSNLRIAFASLRPH